MKKVAVVILNWNGLELLRSYLPSVIDSLPEYAELIIADNASTDKSIDFIKANFSEIKIIQNKSNGGFAKGYNDALKNVNNKFLVLLNSDIETPNNWIEPVIDFMEANPKTGAAMPKILQLKNKTHFEYAGAAGGFIDKWGFPFCRGRIFNELEEDLGQYDNNEPVFWATGACMFVRNDIYKKLGGFDEFFFAHMEEIDLCWRIQRLGFNINAIGNSKIYHLGGGTLNKVSPRKTFLNFRNNLLLLTKNYPREGFLKIITQKIILDGIAGLKFLLEGNFKHTLAIMKAHFAFYYSFPRYLKIRKQLNFQLSNKPVKGLFKASIIKEHFIKKKRKFSDIDPSIFS